MLVSESSKETNKQAGVAYFPSERPEVLDADVVRFKNGEECWIAVVGLMDNQPYEIFTGKVDEDVLPIPKSIKKGRIIKVKIKSTGRSRYDFEYTDKQGYPVRFYGLNRMFNEEFWNYG